MLRLSRRATHYYSTFLSQVVAARGYPRPSKMKLGRPLEVYNYIPFIDGLRGPLIKEIAIARVAEQLRVFGKLDGLRRAPGAVGTLRKVRENRVERSLSDAQNEWVTLPPSLRLRFDILLWKQTAAQGNLFLYAIVLFGGHMDIAPSSLPHHQDPSRIASSEHRRKYTTWRHASQVPKGQETSVRQASKSLYNLRKSKHMPH
jgi:hypothetical protein